MYAADVADNYGRRIDLDLDQEKVCFALTKACVFLQTHPPAGTTPRLAPAASTRARRSIQYNTIKDNSIPHL